MSAEFVLIRGLPGSGKSTMARVLARIGYVHFEADMFFMRDDKYLFDAHQLSEAHDWCQKNAHAYLKAGAKVVVSNTFTRNWEMQPYLDMANELGVPVRIVEADGNWESEHGVPKEAIARMRERWERVELTA